MAARKKISDSHWNTLVRRIHNDQCVAFLGAAVNVGSATYEGLPLGRDVALKLLQDLVGEPGLTFDEAVKAEFHRKLDEYKELKHIGVEDLARVALRFGFVNDRPRLVELLQEILPDAQRQPSPILKTLAALPFKLIVTTNYDRLMERALEEAREAKRQGLHKPVVQSTKGTLDERAWHEQNGALNEWLANRKNLPETFGPIVYKIHGSFQDENPESAPIVITEEDYIEFLTVIGRDVGGIPPPIKAIMQTSTLLFLGYSLEDWDFRTLVKGFAEDLESTLSNGVRSMAIQRSPSDFWVRFWDKKDITIYDVDLYAFSEELETRYRKHVEAQAAR